MAYGETRFEMGTYERGETHADGGGYNNKFIMRFDKTSGEAWILTHVGNGLVWVKVPDHDGK